MILIDFNAIAISTIMGVDKGSTDIVDVGMIRNLLLNRIRSIRSKFNSKYGELVICCDKTRSWRYDAYPLYKHKRKAGREAGTVDWQKIDDIIATIRVEFKENFPYKVLEVNKAEADDIIALICRRSRDANLIVSRDHDFIQLQRNPSVKQYDFMKDSYIEFDWDDMDEFMFWNIVHGCSSDSIPNVKSPDDIFIKDGVRQKSVTKKMSKQWYAGGIESAFDGDMLNNYNRNKKLIDLRECPKEIQDAIVEEYKNVEVASRKGIVKYLQSTNCVNLIEDINKF